jgi:ketosteroid isomerase-like protein
LKTFHPDLLQPRCADRSLQLRSPVLKAHSNDQHRGLPAGDALDFLTTAGTPIAYETERKMAVSEDYVRKIFRGLENGNRHKFLDHLADNVDWIVEGTHPLAGQYRSKAELIAGTFAKRILPRGAQLVVEHILLKDDQAVVELRSLATAENGLRFDTRHCWVVRFCGKTIVQVRAYLDSAMIAHLFDESLPTSDRTAGSFQSGMKLVGSICSSRT